MSYMGDADLVLQLFRDLCQRVSSNSGQQQLFHLRMEPLFLLNAYYTRKSTSVKVVPYCNFYGTPISHL
jgi:hypothetical protein